jgi:hypothetical protein
MAVHGDPEESGGAAAGPLAGECVPHEGERTAVERMRDGALLAQTAQRRRTDERMARPICSLSARLCDAGDGGGSGGGGRFHGRSFSPRSFASLLFRSRVRVPVLHCEIDSRSIPLFISFPKQDPLPSMALVPLIESPDRLGVDRVGERCESYLVPVRAPLVLLMELCTMAATRGAERTATTRSYGGAGGDW